MAGQDEMEIPVQGRSRTGKAVALARLLHLDCTRLLDLYRERESFSPEHAPAGGRIVSLSLSSPDLSTDKQLQLLHAALRKCLGLLDCIIGLEEEEQEEEEEEAGEYRSVRKNVRDRLGHLLHSTKALLESSNEPVDLSADHDCTEETDGHQGNGSFGLKLWTYRVLLELIHWADSASQTLHVLHTEREGTQEI